MSRFLPSLLIVVGLSAGVRSCRTEQGRQQPSGDATSSTHAPKAAGAQAASDRREKVRDAGAGRSVEGRIEDQSLAARIRMALVADAELRPFDFDARVAGGEVTLAGDVQTTAQRSRAASIARNVDGVRHLLNEVAATAEAVTGQRALADAGSNRNASHQAEEEKQTPPASKPKGTFHVVKQGESLWSISRKYNVTVAQLRRLNAMPSTKLMPGRHLRVR